MEVTKKYTSAFLTLYMYFRFFSGVQTIFFCECINNWHLFLDEKPACDAKLHSVNVPVL